MSLATSIRSRFQSTNALSFVLAMVLPLLGSWVTGHTHSLRDLPFAMHFIALAVVATVGGLVPSILAVAVAVISRNYIPQALFGPTSLPHYDVLRVLVIFFGAVIISIGRDRRRRSQHHLQAALKDLQDRTDALIESLHNSKCACWTFDLNNGKSPRWFRGSYPVFGRSFDEVEDLPTTYDLLHADDKPRLATLAQQMRSSWEPIVFEYRCPWPNGELHTLEMRGTRLPGDGCVWRGLTVDVTERKLTEAALLRSEKLAAMGRLASTVAHEINNPLEAVTNLLYLARSSEDLPEPTRSYLSLAERELARLSNITRLTLGFVRTSGSSALTPIAPFVDEVLSIFEHRLENRGISLQRHYHPGLHIRIAPHELRQIATNVIANAIDAVNSQSSAYEPCIVVRTCREEDSAILFVEDNGIGIPADDISRIFEPFFSTKEEVGTGIGLWITRELVERNGGRISLVVPPSGAAPSAIRTTFRIDFPLAPPEASTAFQLETPTLETLN